MDSFSLSLDLIKAVEEAIYESLPKKLYRNQKGGLMRLGRKGLLF